MVKRKQPKLKNRVEVLEATDYVINLTIENINESIENIMEKISELQERIKVLENERTKRTTKTKK